MNKKPEIYVSTDVEADGPIPGMNSMLSFGSAAYLANKTLVSTFEANLELLPGATSNPKTMEWWKTQPQAWEACRENLQSPEKAMAAYLAWLKDLPGIPVFVSYPASYDFMFMYWYLIRFTGESPFSHSALDIKTLAMALLKTHYRKATKKNMPKRWFDDLPHSHKALDDAIEQGTLFCNMLGETITMQRQTPFDDLIIKLNKLGNNSDARLIGSFLREIKEIYLMMKDVSESYSGVVEKNGSILQLIYQKFQQGSPLAPSVKDMMKLAGLDLLTRVRLLYNLLVSTIVSYGDKSELIRNKIPNYFRIKMYRNTVSMHWSEYLPLPTEGSYINFLQGFAIPDYTKSNFNVSEVNGIFRNYGLDISLNDEFMLRENKPHEFDRIYEFFEKKWGEKLTTQEKDLGKLVSELNKHFLIIPINDLKGFFEDLTEQFNK